MTQPIAQRLEAALRPFVGGDLPVQIKAWDGSSAGPPDAPLVVLNSPNAVRRMIRHPNELGAAQAYVTGELEGVTTFFREQAMEATALRAAFSLRGNVLVGRRW